MTYEHDSAVDAGDMFINGLRHYRTNTPLLTGAKVEDTFGTSGGRDDRLHRVANRGIYDGSLTGSTKNRSLNYTYLGSGRLATISAPSPLRVDLKYTTSAGVYDGFDRFGRVKHQEWRISAATSDQFDYTYDYAGNRLTRDIPSSLYAGDDRDQKLAHDNLHQLETFDEGTLSMGNISSPTFEEDYTLDELGNWTNLVKKTGGTTSLDHGRAHNEANETGRSPPRPEPHGKTRRVARPE